MNNGRNFSVIIATYTGKDTIGRTLDSLLAQRPPAAKYEVIVIIDGPNEELRLIANNYKREFENKKINFRVKQFKQNKGRFEARLEGAKIAKNPYILIVDDRIELPSECLEYMVAAGEEAIMPDVKEPEGTNYVSLTLGRIRKKFYGDQWGGKFEPFYIDSVNFDHSAKGTGAFWVAKGVFLNACSKVAAVLKFSKDTSDDTRLLREIVDANIKIYKTPRIRVRYNSRDSVLAELKHIYERGPKFTDYYLHRGRRFFIPLLFFYISLSALVVLLIFYPWLVLIILAVSLISATAIKSNSSELPKVWAGLCLIALSFGAGLLAGVAKRVI